MWCGELYGACQYETKLRLTCLLTLLRSPHLLQARTSPLVPYAIARRQNSAISRETPSASETPKRHGRNGRKVYCRQRPQFPTPPPRTMSSAPVSPPSINTRTSSAPPLIHSRQVLFCPLIQSPPTQMLTQFKQRSKLCYLTPISMERPLEASIQNMKRYFRSRTAFRA